MTKTSLSGLATPKRTRERETNNNINNTFPNNNLSRGREGHEIYEHCWKEQQEEKKILLPDDDFGDNIAKQLKVKTRWWWLAMVSTLPDVNAILKEVGR
jgi:hypothetical protein